MKPSTGVGNQEKREAVEGDVGNGGGLRNLKAAPLANYLFKVKLSQRKKGTYSFAG
jgi:hypothetical protein